MGTDSGGVPNSEDFVEQEPTPITNLGDMFHAMEQTKSVVKRLFQIDMPLIARDAKLARSAADEAREHSIIVRSRQEDFSKRLDKMEVASHPCVQQQDIARLKEQSKEWRQDKEEGIRTREMVRSAQENISKATEEIVRAKTAPKRILAGVLGVGVSMIATIVAVAWTLSGSLATVEASIATEHAVREAQMDSIRERLGELPTDVPTKAQVETIQRTVTENGHSFSSRCQQLTLAQKRSLERQVQSGSLPRSFLCP